VRANAGPIGADILFTLAGYGVLNAIGFIRASVSDWVAAVGLSFLAGVSWVTTITITLLTVGVPLRLPAFVAVSLVTAVAGLAARREWLAMSWPRRVAFGGIRSRVRGLPWQAWIAVPTLVAFAVFAVSGAYMARVRPLTEWDSWSIWSRKAEMLFYTGNLTKDFFAAHVYAFMHPDYPILIPVFESIEYRAMGTIDTRAIHLQFWLLLIAFTLAIIYLGFRRGTLFEWLPLGVLAAIVPAVNTQMLTAYADIPLALFLALGVLLLGEWLTTRDNRTLCVSTLMLIGAANTKNEGLLAAAIVFVVAGIVTLLGARRGEVRQLVFAAAAFVVAILPWRIWLSVEGIHGDISLTKGFDVSYLSGRADRVWPSVKGLYAQLTDQGNWLYVVPLAGALALVCLLIRGRRSLAAFYLASGALAFAALVWVYWISPTAPIDFYLATSAYRVVAVIAAVSFAALLQLSEPTPDE